MHKRIVISMVLFWSQAVLAQDIVRPKTAVLNQEVQAADHEQKKRSLMTAAAQAKFFHVQSNRATPMPAAAPKIDVKLIDYDFAKYGAASERRRLLLKWDAEVKGLAK